MNPLGDELLAHLAAVAARPEIPGGRFEVLELLGRGGMGAVFRARDRELDRDVAIKVAHAAREGAASELGVREEARLAAALEHPSIAPVYDIGTLADGRWYAVMRLVRGKTLTEAAPAGLNARLRLMLPLCAAVEHAHAQGLVHRDLKPSNIMLGEHGELYVMDWGIASRAAERTSIAGTPGFMAPEQIAPGSARIGPHADVYALGGVLAFLASGRAPDRAGGLELDGVPRPLAAIVAKARRAEPSERYASAAALAADVTAYLDREPVAAYREPARERALRFLAKHQFVVWLIAGYLILRVGVYLVARR